jgi:outer membrane lipoprotein SlyB
MKRIVAAGLMVAALGGCATPYAPQEFDFRDISSAGIIESIMPAPRDIHAFDDAMVHEVNPQAAEQLLIRLDDGSAVTLREEGARSYEPGQRVRVTSGRIAPAYE